VSGELLVGDSSDLEEATLWQSNIGRSLSLGDFTAVNVARTDLVGFAVDHELCKTMVDTVVDNHETIRRLSQDPQKMILVCSTLDDEVGLAWALPPTNE